MDILAPADIAAPLRWGKPGAEALHEKRPALREIQMTAIAGILASAATIVTGLVWVAKKLGWYLDKTQAQADQDIDQSNEKEKQLSESSGRPQ